MSRPLDICSKYLTEEAKQIELIAWEQAKKNIRPEMDLGGRGFADPEIIPLCDALNEFPGICTLQSCAGHGEDQPAHIWLWLSLEASEAFDKWGFVLARMRGIEETTVRLTPWGQRITAVMFDGRIREGFDSVLVFFRALITSGSCPPFP